MPEATTTNVVFGEWLDAAQRLSESESRWVEDPTALERNLAASKPHEHRQEPGNVSGARSCAAARATYYDNAQFWTVPDERDERLHDRHTDTVTEPEPDKYGLYDLTLDPIEEHNLAQPGHADDATFKTRCSSS